MVEKSTLLLAIARAKSAHNGETLLSAIIVDMGNTVGSTNTNFCKVFSDDRDAYVLGLWCADGYHRTSSIGITNVNWQLIEKFENFLLKHFSSERLRLKIYEPINYITQTRGKIKTVHFKSAKARQPAYQLYVNSRPLLRELRHLRLQVTNMRKREVIWAYLAGRFDGDGSISRRLNRDCRIVYGNLNEAHGDQALLQRLGLDKTKTYHYQAAKTFCVYISRLQTREFIKGIFPYSVRMQKLVFVPRRDSNP